MTGGGERTSDVEFLDVLGSVPDDGPDEFPTPEPFLRRWHLAAAGLVAAAIVAGIVLDINQPKHRAASPAPPSPAPTQAAAVRPGPPLSGDLFACADQGLCRTASENSPAVSAAMRRHLPGAIISFEVAVTYREGTLQARQLNAVAAGGVLIVVRVLRVSAGTEAAPPIVLNGPVGRSRVGYVRAAMTDGLQVQVQLTGPPDWTPPIESMQALAHDPALLGPAVPAGGKRPVVH